MNEILVGTAEGVFTLDAQPVIGGPHINHLARRDSVVWMIDGEGEVYRDGAVVASGPPGVTLNCIQPYHGTAWVGGSEARLYEIEGEALVEDEFFAAAPGRASWHTPWGGPPDVRSMAVDVDGTLYVNVHVGGILRYDDTGLAATVDIDSDVHQVVAHPDREGVVLAASAIGLGQSGDGHDFEFRTEGLEDTYCRAVAVAGNAVMVSASKGPRGGGAALYRAALDGGGFTRCRTGLPESFQGNLDTHCLLAAGGVWYAANKGTVWVSDDGDRWTTAATGLPRITCLG